MSVGGVACDLPIVHWLRPLLTVTSLDSMRSSCCVVQGATAARMRRGGTPWGAGASNCRSRRRAFAGKQMLKDG
eukprot:1160097-Pelagomonas_calceolata.AAC.5